MPRPAPVIAIALMLAGPAAAFAARTDAIILKNGDHLTGEVVEMRQGKLQVKTPSASLDSMVNIHNPRQCYMTKNWSRDLSLYQLGFGGRGIGFRDSSQDVMGVMASMPEEAKSLIEQLPGGVVRGGG